MKDTKQSRRKPYEAPDVEELEMMMEISILSNEQLEGGEEDDYGDFD